MLFYWNKFGKEKNYVFPSGLGPLKRLFEHLHSIRYWDTDDRLRNTGLTQDWEYRIAEGEGELPVEIELWYRHTVDLRKTAESRLKRIIHNLGGSIVKIAIISEIAYHALLCKMPTAKMKAFIAKANLDVELFRCDEVMYFRPSGQCSSPINVVSDTVALDDLTNVDAVEDIINEPIVALFDGLPLENHEWIKNYIMVDDPDGWSDSYSPGDHIHGTSMASLIVRGDMQVEKDPISRKIYCRPIMKPKASGFDGQKRESIPEEDLPIDVIHRSVLRLFESENGLEPIAPKVKIINLSIADPNRLFEYSISPWAKLIDYLSNKYNVLFVVSAGNHCDEIELDMTNKEFAKLSQLEKEDVILNSISKSTQNRRLLSPAESMNAITVGASHDDEIVENEFSGLINPYLLRAFPSTINPITWGIKRSVKPEVLLPGGRVTYKLKNYLDNDPAVLSIQNYNRPPGQKVAAPGRLGSVNSYLYTFGTSNSAALATRQLSFLHDTLNDLYISPHGKELSRTFESVLLKALLCHGASQSDAFARIEEIVKNETNAKRIKAISAKYLGYGLVNGVRIRGCLDNQATILQCGEIKPDEKHIFKFKLPKDLNGILVPRRVIITLAWFTPIDPRSNKYRLVQLFFAPVTGNKKENYLGINKREVDWQMVRNGTVQHEVLTGNNATVFAEDSQYSVEINCMSAGTNDLAIPYGIVVTLDTPSTEIKIYEQVKAAIEAQFSTPVPVPPTKT